MPTRISLLSLIVLLAPAVAVANHQPAAHSLTGDPLYAQVLPEATQQQFEAELAAARANFESDPNESNTIWLGRRLGYLMRLDEAIAVFDEGLDRFPDSYRLLRHRGHRHITLRRFDAAIRDLERARSLMPPEPMEVEPDGRPNRLGIALSNTQFNVLYHLALAHYLKGDFVRAAAVWRACLDYSNNPDLLVAASDWLYMSLRRMGAAEDAEAVLARVPADTEVIENDAYLMRLRMYRGELPPEALLDTDAEDRALALATQGYGVANWHLYRGETAKARALFDEILSGEAWAAFGFIAAEADRLRLSP